MSTLDNPNMIQKMLTNNGKYRGDPEPHSIWQYRSGFNTVVYKVNRTEKEELNFLAIGNILPMTKSTCLFEGTRLDPKTGQFTEPKVTSSGQAWLTYFKLYGGPLDMTEMP